MDVYLPIAGMSVNALVIVLLGGGVGFLSGMLGVGGGFLITPLLIFYGVPPAIAVGSSATQITGSSVSGALAYARRKGIDVKMGAVLVAGGLAGSVAGSFLFELLQKLGQIDTTISIVYVLLLVSIGGLMLRESVQTLWPRKNAPPRPRARRHNRFVAALPWKMRFYRSNLYISPIAPFVLGFFVGTLNVIMGIGGGFIILPAMIYIFGMAASVVVGTSLFQIVFVTAATTLLHATQSKTVDIVLAGLLLIGGVVGAQYGVVAARHLPAEKLRFGLAVIILLIGVRLMLQLTYRPGEIFSVTA